LQIRRLERSGDSYRPEERVLAEKVMALPAETGRDLEVPLEFSPMRIGLSVYALTASVEMDEPVTRNNTRLFAVDVREKKTRILYIENEPDWDFTFLRRTLDADTSLSYTYLVRRPNGSYDNYNDVGAARLPRSSDELSPYAAVILGKVTSASLPLETVAVIRDYVIGGGGLLLLGGAKETGGGRSPAMWQDILPVRIIADRRSGYTSSLTTLSPSGMAHGITGVKQGDQIGTGGWENRPPIWIQEGQYSLAPGANMLISARTAHPAKEVPIFSLLHAGQGRVAMMSARGFWRWDFSTRSKSEQRSQAGEFWKRTMRWISEPSQKERFRINPAKYVFQDSEALSFSAVLQDASHNPVSDARIEVTLEPIVFIESDAAIEDRDSMAGERNQVPGGPGAAIHLQMYPAGSAGRYNATGAPQRPGMYRYEAVALVDGEAEPLRSGGQFWVEEMGPEFYHLASSPRLGEYLARVSDGMAARPDEMDRLAEEIPSLYKRVEVVRQAEIWNHWLLFGTLVLLLSIEWIIRRRRGLA